MTRRRVLTTVIRTMAATALMAGAITVAAPGAAHATTKDCERGANGFVDIPETQGGTERGRVDLHPGSPHSPGAVRLMTANIGGQQRGFAKITAGVVGDDFWMDWTNSYSNGSASSWIQCGPFEARTVHEHTTAAKETNSSNSWRFRACGSSVYGDRVVCTGWW